MGFQVGKDVVGIDVIVGDQVGKIAKGTYTENSVHVFCGFELFVVLLAFDPPSRQSSPFAYKLFPSQNLQQS